MQVNLPLVNQITDPDVNHNEDCVAACVASCATALLGRTITLDWLKDIAYGSSYKGFQDAMQYQSVLNSIGLKVVQVSGYLPTVVVDALNHGQPVLLTIPSDWGDNPPTSPYSHVVAAGGASGGDITSMNPWGGFYQIQPYGWWVSRQRGNLYIIEKDASHMPIPSGWKDDGKTLTAPNGHTVVLGFREHIITADAWASALQPTEEEHGTGAGSLQNFSLNLTWDKATGAIQEQPAVPASPASLAAMQLPPEEPVQPVVTQVIEPAPVVAEVTPEPATPVADEVAPEEPEEPTTNTALSLIQKELERLAAKLAGK